MKKLFCGDDKTAYYATEEGQIWSLRKRDGLWRELKPRKTPDGYLQFACCQNGKVKDLSVHRAVYEAFNGPIPPGLQINHLNTVRDDNRLENLEVVTPSGNQNHPLSRKHAREAARPRMRPVRDLSTGVVYESIREAARQTGLHRADITRCCNGKRNQTGGHIFKFAS